MKPKRYGSHGAILESTPGPYPSSTSGSNGGRTNHTLHSQHHHQRDNRPIRKVHQLKSRDSSLQSSGSYRDNTHRELPSASSSSSSSQRYKKHHQQRSRPRLHSNEDIILSSESDSEGSDVDHFRSRNNNKQTSGKRPALHPSSSSTSTPRSSNKPRRSTSNEKDLMVIDDDSSDHEQHPLSSSSPFSLRTPPRIEQSASSSSIHKGNQRSPSPATLFEQEATISKQKHGRNGHGIILRDDDVDDFQPHKKQKRESRSPELFQSESSRRRSESIDRIGKAVFMSVDEEMDHLLNNGPTRDLRDSPRFSSGKFNAFKSSVSSMFSKTPQPPQPREHSGKVTLIDSDEEEPALRRRGISVPNLDDEDSGKEEEIHWLQEDEKKKQDQSSNNKQKQRSKSEDDDDGEYSEDAKTTTTTTKKKRSLTKGKLYTQSATRSSRRLAAKQEPLCISIDEDSDDQAIPVQTAHTASEEEQP